MRRNNAFCLNAPIKVCLRYHTSNKDNDDDENDDNDDNDDDDREDDLPNNCDGSKGMSVSVK